MTLASRRHGVRLFAIAALVAVVAMLAPVATASAQDAVNLDLLATELEEDGATRLTLAVTGDVGDDPLDAGHFTVTENGQQIDGLDVEALTEEDEREPATVMILFDVSGSAAGEPIEAARDAAIDLVEELVPEGVEMGLAPFATDAELITGPTDDLDVLTAALDDLEAGGSTALYDAIVLGAEQLEDVTGQRSLVLFTDGADTSSDATLEEAVAASAGADAPITNVALLTDDQDPEVLDALAEETEGRLLEVADVGGLSDAFLEVAQSFTNQYVVTYEHDDLAPELDLQVAVEVDGASAEQRGVVINQRVEQVETGESSLPTREAFDAGWLGTDAGLYTALAAAFVALVLLLGVLIVPSGDRAASQTLRRTVTMVQRGDRQPKGPSSGVTASSLGQRAVEMVERVPRPEGYDERLQTDIDRAGWQLRATEFTAMRVGAALAGLLGLWALSGNWLLGVVGLLAGVVGPVLFLNNSKERRQARFMEQLPQTLQLLSGTLRAGYGLLQGIDTIVKETEDPMSSEFQRVLTEARLGLPLEDSLDAMADRVESEDFRWVVVAMNIQRQVGGNLAELLETVSETLRGREQVQRQIKVLSAEGKLSAIVLIALPFVILGYMLVVNPAYLMTLFTHIFGLAMVGGAGLLMIVGIFWIRRMIQIDV